MTRQRIGSIKGPKGDPGADSTVPGPKGDTGDQGERGPRGFPGDQGPVGERGPRGLKGDQGDKGDRGADSTIAGPRGYPGDKGERGYKGDPGEDSIVPGPKGNQGDRGYKGDKGDKGDPGLPGAKGDKGTNGTNGTNGAPGPKGDKGDPGPPGTGGGDVPANVMKDPGYANYGQVLTKYQADTMDDQGNIVEEGGYWWTNPPFPTPNGGYRGEYQPGVFPLDPGSVVSKDDILFGAPNGIDEYMSQFPPVFYNEGYTVDLSDFPTASCWNWAKPGQLVNGSDYSSTGSEIPSKALVVENTVTSSQEGYIFYNVAVYADADAEVTFLLARKTAFNDRTKIDVGFDNSYDSTAHPVDWERHTVSLPEGASSLVIEVTRPRLGNSPGTLSMAIGDIQFTNSHPAYGPWYPLTRQLFEAPVGTPGAKGDQGIQGVKGDKGDTGAKGDQGNQGIQGLKGDVGSQGLPGAKGDQGNTGPGVPAGGTAGQFLKKKTGADLDTVWADFAASGGGYKGLWTPGAYLAGSIVKRSGFIFGAKVDTSEAPFAVVSGYSNDFSGGKPTDSFWNYKTPSGGTVDVVPSNTAIDYTPTVPADSTLSANELRIKGGAGNTENTVELTLNFPAGGSIEFLDLHSASNGDPAAFYIDGVQKHTFTNNGWYKRTYAVTAGTHVFSWRLVHDASGNAAPDIYLVASLKTTGSLVAPVDWEQLTAASAAGGYKGNWSAGTYVAGSVVKKSGVVYATKVDTASVPSEPVTNYTPTFAPGPVPSDPWWSYSTASGATNDIVAASSQTASAPATGSAPVNMFRMKGGVPNTENEASLTLDFPSGGTISFHDLNNAEGADYGVFYIDGVQKHSQSNAGWTYRTYNVAPGTHVFKWRHHHDSSVNAGLDDYCFGNLVTVGSAAGVSDWEKISSPVIDGLSDVDTTTTAPTNNMVLKYDSASGLWKPKLEGIDVGAWESRTVNFTYPALTESDYSAAPVAVPATRPTNPQWTKTVVASDLVACDDATLGFEQIFGVFVSMRHTTSVTTYNAEVTRNGGIVASVGQNGGSSYGLAGALSLAVPTIKVGDLLELRIWASTANASYVYIASGGMGVMRLNKQQAPNGGRYLIRQVTIPAFSSPFSSAKTLSVSPSSISFGPTTTYDFWDNDAAWTTNGAIPGSGCMICSAAHGFWSPRFGDGDLPNGSNGLSSNMSSTNNSFIVPKSPSQITYKRLEIPLPTA